MKKPLDLPDPPPGWHHYQPEHEGATEPRGFTKKWNANLHANLVIDDSDPLRTFWQWQVHEGIDVTLGRAAVLDDAREAAEQAVERVRSQVASIGGGHLLVLGDDGRGHRHMLDGKPVHAGDLLELLQPNGSWVLGRYEWSWRRGERPRFYIDGATPPVMLGDDARLRWPEVGRRQGGLIP